MMESNELPVLHFISTTTQTVTDYVEEGSFGSNTKEWDEAPKKCMYIGDDMLRFTRVDEDCVEIEQVYLKYGEPSRKQLHRGETVVFSGESEESDHDGMTREVYEEVIQITWRK